MTEQQHASYSGPYGPDPNWSGWWFARQTEHDNTWQAVLQLDDMALPLDGIWFYTQADCTNFIRDHIIPRAGQTEAT